MDGRKWVIAAIISVIVLALVAVALVGVLTFSTVKQLEAHWEEERYEQREEKPEKAPQEMEGTIPVEEPAEEVQVPAEETPRMDFRVGLITSDASELSVQITESFAQTCADFGLAAEIYTLNSDYPEEQLEICMVMIESGIDAIAVMPMDRQMMEEIAAFAIDVGVPLVSVDLCTDEMLVSNAMLNVDCWGSNSEKAVQLLTYMAEYTDYTGKFGVVAPTEKDPVFDEMERAIGYLPDMKNVVWKASGHGNGSYESCVDSVSYMLSKNEKLNAIICTDPMTTQVAAQVISENGYDVQLFGFGNPAELKDYMPDGILIYINPDLIGRSIVRAMVGILDGTLTLEEDSTLYNGEYNYYLYIQDGALSVFVAPDAMNGAYVRDWSE